MALLNLNTNDFRQNRKGIVQEHGVYSSDELSKNFSVLKNN